MTRSLRSVAALIAWVALGALAPGALSAPPLPPETPPDAPVVAGPTPSGARLVAFDNKRRLCGDVRRRRNSFSEGECTRPTGRLRDPLLQTAFDGRGRRAWHWGFVAPEVAAVEVVMRDGLRVTVPAEDGPAYTGRYAGRVRFFIAEGRGARGQEVRYVKLLAADGSVLALVEHFFGADVRVGRSVELARGGSGPGRWSLQAFRRRSLAPLPGDEERFVDQDCVEVRPERGARLAQVCAHRDFPRDLSAFGSDQACGAVGSATVGLVGPEVRTARATLGDGRSRELRLRRLPARYGPRRVFALVLAPDVAVRRVVTVDRDGRRHALSAGMPPGAARCGDDGGFITTYGEHPEEPRGPLAFTVYDDGVLLCATLGRPAPNGSDCGHPPLEDYDARILEWRAGGRTLIAGVLPLQAATAVVELVGGERRRLATTTAGPYAGRYNGLVRFFALELPGDRRLRLVRLLDAQGRRVDVSYGDHTRAVTRPRLLASAPGGLGLRGLRVWVPSIRRGYSCIWFGRSGAGDDAACGFPSADFANLTATCSPRRLFFWGLLPGVRVEVTVETDRGPVRARVVRLPRSLWEREARSAFLAAVPASAAPRALVLSAGQERSRRHRLRLPPAARQCGYETFLSTYPPISVIR